MQKNRQDLRKKRKLHIRKTVSGSSEKPRVYVYISNTYLYVGLANDTENKVIISMKSNKNSKTLEKFGEDFGKKVKGLGYDKLVFDRSGYKFGLRLTNLVNGIRKSGISI